MRKLLSIFTGVLLAASTLAVPMSVLPVRTAWAADEASSIVLDSASGDYIGAGQYLAFASPPETFTAQRARNGLAIGFVGSGHWFYFNFSGPNSAFPSIGTYEGARRGGTWSWLSDVPGIDVYGDGRGCNDTYGSFQIAALDVAEPSGVVTNLDMVFEQHCEWATSPALLGHIVIHASVPPTDLDPPVLSLPSGWTQEAWEPAGYWVWYSASAWDERDGDVGVTCAPESGSFFPLGDTLVTCTARDHSGNEASASFTVSVVDTIPPDVSFVGNAEVYHLDSDIEIRCDATDIVSGQVDCPDYSTWGWELGVGAFEYTVNVSDQAGNEAGASTTFEVVASYPAMLTLTSAWVTKPGVAGSLINYLDLAALADARGNTRAEDGALTAYRRLLRSQAGKSISADDAVRLIAFSNAL